MAGSSGPAGAGEAPPQRRPVGRPRSAIDREQIVAVLGTIFAREGLDAISVDRVASELGVSRATLRRSVPTIEHLHWLVFEKLAGRTLDAARAVAASAAGGGEKLAALLQIQVDAAIETRVFYILLHAQLALPAEVDEAWRSWRRAYEDVWVQTVTQAAREGAVTSADPLLTTRLLLGMTTWIARWYRPEEGIAPEAIRQAVADLLGTGGTGAAGSR